MQGLMTELEAVNKILAVAGDSPVQTLEDDYVQAKLARQILTRASRKVQSKGWWFNEEECVKLNPDSNGFIYLGTNIIKMIALKDYGDIIQRGNRVYNRGERTYVFSTAISADIVLALNWDELPQTVREYISDVACTQYNNDYYGDDTIKQKLAENESLSLLAVRSDDTEARDVNMMDNSTAAKIAFRHRRG